MRPGVFFRRGMAVFLVLMQTASGGPLYALAPPSGSEKFRKWEEELRKDPDPRRLLEPEKAVILQKVLPTQAFRDAAAQTDLGEKIYYHLTQDLAREVAGGLPEIDDPGNILSAMNPIEFPQFLRDLTLGGAALGADFVSLGPETGYGKDQLLQKLENSRGYGNREMTQIMLRVATPEVSEGKAVQKLIAAAGMLRSNKHQTLRLSLTAWVLQQSGLLSGRAKKMVYEYKRAEKELQRMPDGEEKKNREAFLFKAKHNWAYLIRFLADSLEQGGGFAALRRLALHEPLPPEHSLKRFELFLKEVNLKLGFRAGRPILLHISEPDVKEMGESLSTKSVAPHAAGQPEFPAAPPGAEKALEVYKPMLPSADISAEVDADLLSKISEYLRQGKWGRARDLFLAACMNPEKMRRLAKHLRMEEEPMLCALLLSQLPPSLAAIFLADVICFEHKGWVRTTILVDEAAKPWAGEVLKELNDVVYKDWPNLDTAAGRIAYPMAANPNIRKGQKALDAVLQIMLSPKAEDPDMRFSAEEILAQIAKRMEPFEGVASPEQLAKTGVMLTKPLPAGAILKGSGTWISEEDAARILDGYLASGDKAAMGDLLLLSLDPRLAFRLLDGNPERLAVLPDILFLNAPYPIARFFSTIYRDVRPEDKTRVLEWITEELVGLKRAQGGEEKARAVLEEMLERGDRLSGSKETVRRILDPANHLALQHEIQDLYDALFETRTDMVDWRTFAQTGKIHASELTVEERVFAVQQWMGKIPMAEGTEQEVHDFVSACRMMAGLQAKGMAPDLMKLLPDFAPNAFRFSQLSEGDRKRCADAVLKALMALAPAALLETVFPHIDRNQIPLRWEDINQGVYPDWLAGIMRYVWYLRPYMERLGPDGCVNVLLEFSQKGQKDNALKTLLLAWNFYPEKGRKEVLWAAKLANLEVDDYGKFFPTEENWILPRIFTERGPQFPQSADDTLHPLLEKVGRSIGAETAARVVKEYLVRMKLPTVENALAESDQSNFRLLLNTLHILEYFGGEPDEVMIRRIKDIVLRRKTGFAGYFSGPARERIGWLLRHSEEYPSGDLGPSYGLRARIAFELTTPAEKVLAMIPGRAPGLVQLTEDFEGMYLFHFLQGLRKVPWDEGKAAQWHAFVEYVRDGPIPGELKEPFLQTMQGWWLESGDLELPARLADHAIFRQPEKARLWMKTVRDITDKHRDALKYNPAMAGVLQDVLYQDPGFADAIEKSSAHAQYFSFLPNFNEKRNEWPFLLKAFYLLQPKKMEELSKSLEHLRGLDPDVQEQILPILEAQGRTLSGPDIAGLLLAQKIMDPEEFQLLRDLLTAYPEIRWGGKTANRFMELPLGAYRLDLLRMAKIRLKDANDKQGAFENLVSAFVMFTRQKAYLLEWTGLIPDAKDWRSFAEKYSFWSGLGRIADKGEPLLAVQEPGAPVVHVLVYGRNPLTLYLYVFERRLSGLEAPMQLAGMACFQSQGKGNAVTVPAEESKMLGTLRELYAAAEVDVEERITGMRTEPDYDSKHGYDTGSRTVHDTQMVRRIINFSTKVNVPLPFYCRSDIAGSFGADLLMDFSLALLRDIFQVREIRLAPVKLLETVEGKYTFTNKDGQKEERSISRTVEDEQPLALKDLPGLSDAYREILSRHVLRDAGKEGIVYGIPEAELAQRMRTAYAEVPILVDSAYFAHMRLEAAESPGPLAMADESDEAFASAL